MGVGYGLLGDEDIGYRLSGIGRTKGAMGYRR